MDLLSNLQKKYYDLLRPVQSGLSNLGNAEKQGAQALSQGIQQGANFVSKNLPQVNAFQPFSPVGVQVKNPINFNVTPYAQQFVQGAGKAIGEAIPAVQRMTNPLVSSYKNPVQPLQDLGTALKGTGYILSPEQALIGGGINSLFQAGNNLKNKKPILDNSADAFRQGADFSATLSPLGNIVGGALKPGINKATSLIPGENVAANLFKNVLGGVGEQAATGGAYGVVTGQNPLSTAAQFAPYGLLHGLNPNISAKENLKGVNPKAFDLHPQDAEELAQIGQKLLKAKPGEILPKQQTATLERTFKYLFPGYNIDKMSNKQIADVIGATLDRYNQVPEKAPFPSMGIVDNKPLAGDTNVVQGGGIDNRSVEGLMKQGYTKDLAEFILQNRQDMMDIKSPGMENILKNSNKYTPIGNEGTTTIYRVTPKGQGLTEGKMVFTSEADAIAFRDNYGYKRGQPEIIKQTVNNSDLLKPNGSGFQNELVYAPNVAQGGLLYDTGKWQKMVDEEVQRLYDDGKRAGYQWANKPLSSVKSYLEKQAVINVAAKPEALSLAKAGVSGGEGISPFSITDSRHLRSTNPLKPTESIIPQNLQTAYDLANKAKDKEEWKLYWSSNPKVQDAVINEIKQGKYANWLDFWEKTTGKVADKQDFGYYSTKTYKSGQKAFDAYFNGDQSRVAQQPLYDIKKLINDAGVSPQAKIQEIPLNKIGGADEELLNEALRTGKKLTPKEANDIVGRIEDPIVAGRKITSPISVGIKPDGSYYLLSGNNRVAQALVNGQKTISAASNDFRVGQSFEEYSRTGLGSQNTLPVPSAIKLGEKPINVSSNPIISLSSPQQPITDIGTPGKTVDHLTKINNSNIDPTTIKLSGTPDELTAAKRAKSMVPIEKLDKPVILKINKDGNLQVVDGNARVTAHINQNQPITNWILNTKESDKVALNKFFPSSPQQPLGGVSDASTIRTNPTEGQISQKTPVTEGAGATEVKPLQLKSGESPQIPKNPENGVQSASDSIISKVKDKVNKFYTQSMDRFHPLSSLAHQAGEDRAMRNALTGYYGSGSTAQYHIDYELSPILKSVDVNELRKASIALRDAELQGRGIKGSNTGALGELLGKQGQGSKDPKMGEALQKLYKYQDNLVQEYLVKTGIMSPESYAAMKKNNQFYVPFKRVMDQVDEYLGGTPQTKGAGSVSGQNVIKGIKGSDKAIHDPLESIVENTYKLVGLGKRQEVAKTIVGLKDKLPEGVISKISGKLPLNKNNVVALFENGKVEHYKVPMEVADAAKGMSEEQMNMIVKVLAAPTRVFRATATGMNPEFAIPNVVRDVQSAFVNVGVNPLKWVSGLAHMIKQDEVYQEFLKSGGLTSRISLDRPYLKKTVADISGTPKQALRLTDPRRIKGVLEALGQYSEQPTRIASFEKTLSGSLKKGLSREEALKDAAYAAQEGTVNFARRGSKTQGLNAIYAFLNARAQGTDRIIRSIKADPKGAGIRLGMISVAPAIATYAWNRNFPSYNDKNVVPDYVKQNNFVIMLSNSPISQLGGAQYIAIPKGDVGKLANPIESFLSYADGKGGDVRGSLASTLGAFSPFNNIGDIIPTAIRPITENAANYNFFYGRPIIADSKKNYPAPYQTSKSTPAIYNQAGQFLNQSPNMIQNLSRGYLTGFARIGEQLTQPFANKDNYSGSDVNQTPIIRRFLQGPVRSQDEQQMQDFYQQKDIQNKIQDIKTGIKYGNIPMDAGMNEIKRLMNQQTQSTQPQSYFGAQSASASEKSPVQDKLQEDQAKMRVFMNQKSEMLGDKIYVPTDSGASVIDLNPQPTGTGIKAFVDQNKKYDIARQVWDAPISQEQKNAAFQKLGVDPQDVRYDSLAHNGTDVSVQYIKSKSPDHQTLLNNLVTGRVVSISGQQFAGDKVIDALNSQGLLSDAESKALKALKLDRNMNNIAKVKSGRGRKPRLIKVKAIKIPKTKRIKIKTPKITKVKQYTLSKVTKVKKLKA